MVYGEGIENYMNDAPVDVGIENELSSNPRTPIEGKALPVLGVVALPRPQLERQVDEHGRLLDASTSTTPTARRPSAFKKGQYALANMLYYPVQGRDVLGPEVQWGKRENFNDGFTLRRLPHPVLGQVQLQAIARRQVMSERQDAS